MRHAAASASSATAVECSRNHGDLRSVNAAIAAKAVSTRSPAIQICGDGSIASACSHIRVSSSSARIVGEAARGEIGQSRLVCPARPLLDHRAGGLRSSGGQKTEMSRATCTSRIGKGIASPPATTREVQAVPALKDVFECRLGARTESEPSGESLRHLAVHGQCLAGRRQAVGDGLLDHDGTELRRAAESDVRPEERDDLLGIARVDERERGPRHDVVPVDLRGLVSVRRATRGVQERDVVRIDELLRRRSGELAQPDREHRGAQRVLERLPRPEVGRQRQRTHHLGRTDRPLPGRRPSCACCRILRVHGDTLTRSRPPILTAEWSGAPAVARHTRPSTVSDSGARRRPAGTPIRSIVTRCRITLASRSAKGSPCRARESPPNSARPACAVHAAPPGIRARCPRSDRAPHRQLPRPITGRQPEGRSAPG